MPLDGYSSKYLASIKPFWPHLNYFYKCIPISIPPHIHWSLYIHTAHSDLKKIYKKTCVRIPIFLQGCVGNFFWGGGEVFIDPHCWAPLNQIIPVLLGLRIEIFFSLREAPALCSTGTLSPKTLLIYLHPCSSLFSILLYNNTDGKHIIDIPHMLPYDTFL